MPDVPREAGVSSAAVLAEHRVSCLAGGLDQSLTCSAPLVVGPRTSPWPSERRLRSREAQPFPLPFPITRSGRPDCSEAGGRIVVAPPYGGRLG